MPAAREPVAEGSWRARACKNLLGRLIDDFGLSVRSLNSLKNSNIRTLRDLVAFSEDELLKVKNVGEKALAEIRELLEREGLTFGLQSSRKSMAICASATKSEMRSAAGPDARRGGVMRHRAKGRQLSRTSEHKRGAPAQHGHQPVHARAAS